MNNTTISVAQHEAEMLGMVDQLGIANKHKHEARAKVKTLEDELAKLKTSHEAQFKQLRAKIGGHASSDKKKGKVIETLKQEIEVLKTQIAEVEGHEAQIVTENTKLAAHIEHLFEDLNPGCPDVLQEVLQDDYSNSRTKTAHSVLTGLIGDGIHQLKSEPQESHIEGFRKLIRLVHEADPITGMW
jgi:chromosome segregation ATPase